MRHLLLYLSLPTILIVISGSQSASLAPKSSSNVPDESEEWSIGFPMHTKQSRHKRRVGIQNALTNFGHFSSFVGVADVLYGLISASQPDKQLEEIQLKLKELEKKIDGISRDIETILYGQRTALYGSHVRRLRFFLSYMANFLTPQNGTWAPANEAQRWADNVLALRSDGAAQILHDMHDMVIGVSHVFASKPLFLVFEEALNGSSPNYAVQVQEIIEFFDSIQSSGYAVWINALFIKGRNSSVAEVELVSKERFTKQAKLIRQMATGWPSGSYGLPMPDTGCPKETETGVNWKTGYRYHDTEHDNEWSRNLRFPAGSWGKDFVYQHFCMLNNTVGLRRWPNGEYCLFKKGDCPQGFSTGWIKWDDNDFRNANNRSGYIPDGNYIGLNGWTRIYYCCRSDASPSIPIDLPTDKPFYFLRYKSSCQQVRNMRLSNQFFWWDDQDYNNGNWISGASSPVTGSDIWNHKIHYCYYY